MHAHADTIMRFQCSYRLMLHEYIEGERRDPGASENDARMLSSLRAESCDEETSYCGQQYKKKRAAI